MGGHNKLPMATLRELAAAAGFDEPRTHIQSGNIVFGTGLDAAAAGERLAAAIRDEADIDVAVVTRSAGEWAAVIERNPYPEAARADPKLIHVVLLDEEPGDLGIDTADFEPETFDVSGRDVYLSLPGGLGRSKLAAEIDKALSDMARTTRNWNTILAIARLLED